jgi:hypothetical protein
MDRTSSTSGGEEECIGGFSGKTRRKETSEILDVSERIILK